MALANYTDLKASIASWLPRSDLTSLIPDFIALAEAAFNRELRTLQQETRATFTISGEFVAVPNDFLEVRSLQLDTDIRAMLECVAPDAGVDGYTVAGTPRKFAISGGTIRFAPVPDATYSATLIYYAKIPPMSLNATNWLLTAYPDLYLYTSLYYAAVHTRDQELGAAMKPLSDELMGRLNASSRRSRWGGNGMAMRAA